MPDANHLDPTEYVVTPFWQDWHTGDVIRHNGLQQGDGKCVLGVIRHSPGMSRILFFIEYAGVHGRSDEFTVEQFDSFFQFGAISLMKASLDKPKQIPVKKSPTWIDVFSRDFYVGIKTTPQTVTDIFSDLPMGSMPKQEEAAAS